MATALQLAMRERVLMLPWNFGIILPGQTLGDFTVLEVLHRLLAAFDHRIPAAYFDQFDLRRSAILQTRSMCYYCKAPSEHGALLPNCKHCLDNFKMSWQYREVYNGALRLAYSDWN